MKQKGASILNEYDLMHGLHENLKSSTDLLVKNLLKLESLTPHQVTSRLKGRDSLEKKIIRENYKYDSLKQITDIVGLRIVTYFEDEIDVIAKLIEKEFEIDQINSVDKRVLATDKFGYRSLHYVVEYKSDRLKLLEYSSFKKLKFEIQIRSILQHSWAEIEHDIGYKGENEIPDSAKRTFFRVAALLEQADIEFVKLKKEIIDYEIIVDEKVKKSPATVEINKASVTSFMINNKMVKEAEKRLVNSRKGLNIIPLEKRDFVTNERIEKILNTGIKTIQDLEKTYKENKKELINNKIKRWENDYVISGFVEGATVFWIMDII